MNLEDVIESGWYFVSKKLTWIIFGGLLVYGYGMIMSR